MGRIILLTLICFAAYWGWQYYKARNKPKEQAPDWSGGASKQDAGPPSKVDELIAEFNKKIADIESKSAEEIRRSQELLDYYRSELEKLNKLKNK